MTWIFYVPMHLLLVLWKGTLSIYKGRMWRYQHSNDFSERFRFRNWSLVITIYDYCYRLDFFYFFYISRRATIPGDKTSSAMSPPSLITISFAALDASVQGTGRAAITRALSSWTQPVYLPFQRYCILLYKVYIYIHYIWPLTEFRASTSKTH